MNLTTTGFPFGGSPLGGLPASGTPAGGFPFAAMAGGSDRLGQGFAQMLGATGLDGLARVGAGAANDLIPAFANDAAPANPLVRAQAAPSPTLAQLLASGTKAPGADPAAAEVGPRPAANAPDPLPSEAGAPVPAQDPASAPGTGETGPVVTETGPFIAETGPKPDPKAPPKAATPVTTDAGEPAPLPAGPAEAPVPPLAPPAKAATATAQPVKARKAVADDGKTPALPADPQPAQPVAMPVVAGPAPQPAAPAPERKPDGARGGKTAPVALAQSGAPATNDAALPAAARPNDDARAASGDAFSSDMGQPTELAAKAEPRAAGSTPAPQQGFAAHVAQAVAPAQAATPAHAAAPADPVVPARPGQLGQALGVEIARKVEAGESTLRVRMNPAELGRVEVTLAFDDSGRLHATMRAESHHALELLRQDAPDLGRALDSAGIRADTQSFRFESRGEGGAGGTGGQPGQQQSRGQGQQAFHDEPETPAPDYRPIRGDGQVDLLA